MRFAPTIRAAGVVAVLVIFLAATALTAPGWMAEYLLRRHGPLIGPPPPRPVRGAWVGDYFVVEPIDPLTFAIGEPRYYQGNYSYLILGRRRAVLFDAGTGNRDIASVARGLTALPITVIPSHLHFDHVGALGRLDRTALIDLPALRERARGGVLSLGRYEFLGFADQLPRPRFRVDEWWQPGSRIDLGDRRLVVLHTPGHTSTSVSLYDSDRRQLFCGDFIYPGMLYAFLPDASRSDYLATARRLLKLLDPAARLYTAHMADDPALIAAPVLEVADLRALESTLTGIAAGTTDSKGLYPRVFPVRGAITFGAGFPWAGR